MKKYLLIVTAFIFMSSMTYAQKGRITASLGADVALPLGDFGEYSKIGFGGTGKGHYGISDQGDITLTLGYLSFGSKGSNDFMSIKTGMVPIMPGYRHKFDSFYLEPQLGLMSLKTKVKSSILDDYGFGSFGSAGSASYFSYALGGGIMLDRLDLGVRFQGVSSGGSLHFIGARIGYVLFSN